MKKIKDLVPNVIAFFIIAFIIIFVFIIWNSLTNRSLFDTVYKFDKAIVCLADGSVVEGKVSSWIDYEDGDVVQVTVEGVTYLVHYSNVTLIAE